MYERRSVANFRRKEDQIFKPLHSRGIKIRMTKAKCVFTFLLVYMLVCGLVFLSVCTRPPHQTKNDTGLKFDTHTSLDHI